MAACTLSACRSRAPKAVCSRGLDVAGRYGMLGLSIVSPSTGWAAGGSKVARRAVFAPREGGPIMAVADDKVRGINPDVNSSPIPDPLCKPEISASDAELDDGALGEVAGGGVVAGSGLLAGRSVYCCDCNATYQLVYSGSGGAYEPCPECGSSSYVFL